MNLKWTLFAFLMRAPALIMNDSSVHDILKKIRKVILKKDYDYH